jgi:signal transduction histidine kinase
VIVELFRHASRDVVTARGAGVGLAIVKRYVELLGGQIHLASVPGEGSTFTVTLPADRPAAG